jgi:hypothetical protein
VQQHNIGLALGTHNAKGLAVGRIGLGKVLVKLDC